MADSSFVRANGPANWHQAFAAMPAEAAPADAWTAIAGRLPVAPVRRTPRVGRVGASAVAAVLIAAAGFTLLRPEPTPAPVDQGVVRVAVAHRAPRPVMNARSNGSATGAGTRSHVDASPVAVDARASKAAGTSTSVASAAMHSGANVARLAAQTAPLPRLRQRDGVAPTPIREIRVASASTPEATVASPATHDTAISTPASTATTLANLRAESARLEALAALARDDRMGSAPAMVLAADAEDRVRLVDAALSRPDLGEAQVLDLWTRRVAALRELAGVEGTNRWLAANGESLQGAIALVD